MRQTRNVILFVLAFVMFSQVPGFAASVLISWNANTESDLAGYNLYYGTQSGIYGTKTDVENVTTYQFNAQTGTTYYFAITAYDTSGNESGYSSEVSIYVPVPDATPPTGTVVINSGSATTPSRVVTLSLSASDAGGTVVAMKISNDGVTWSGEAPFAASQSWVLTEGDGVKTVYVNFKDASGNWMSTAARDTIELRLDTDGDGMPNTWEASYGLDPNNPTDAALDLDNDGLSNYEEYYNGSNPASASDNTPYARAGSDRQTAPTRVYLDGTASTDPNGDTLQYTWSFVSGPAAVTIENPTSTRASFVGTKAGLYRFMLKCFDGKSTGSDTVDITILNVAPNVNAGGDTTVTVGTQVLLHATGTDSNEDDLTYQWKFVQGSAMTLPSMNQQNITLMFSAAGQYRFSVTCSDGTLTSPADEIIVIANAVNRAPTANAGPDQSVQVGSQVTLDGSGSTDPDGNSLTYAWRQVSGTAVTLQNSQGASPAFAAVAAGTFEFELVVNDGLVSSTAERVWVTVLRQNNAPVADAGDDINAYAGDPVVLDGAGSYDPDGDMISYTWTQTSGASVVLTGAQTARPSFTPTTSGVLGFTLKVSDGQAATQDTVLVTVDNFNQVPVAEAGQDKTVKVGDAVTLDGRLSSDPDGDPISYIWSQTSGTRISLNYSNTATPSFVPTVAGVYVFELKVYDGKDTSSPDTVTVAVQQSAVAISLLTPQMGAIMSENPLFSWNASDFSRYKVYITVNGKKYSNIYNGTGTSCRMSSMLWNLFIPSGTTINWYVEGTTTDRKTIKSSMGNFKKR